MTCQTRQGDLGGSLLAQPGESSNGAAWTTTPCYTKTPRALVQFFDEGQAPAGPGDPYAHGGSAGCVNLSVPDARRLWDLLAAGDAVYVWGTKPGTED